MANMKWQTSNTKHQTPNIKWQTSNKYLGNVKHPSHIKQQMAIATTISSCFSFDITKAGPINWIKLSGKQIERSNQELEKLNQRWNNQQIFQELHQSKIRDP